MFFDVKMMRHFLIPWIFTLLTETVFGQQQTQPSLTDLHNLLLQGAPYRPLFERISPLDGLHVLHQAVAVTPIPENQAINRLDILGMATPAASQYFNPNHRFLTVTVPNPLFNPNLLPSNNFSPETNKKTAEIVKSLPHTISAAILNATEQNKIRAVEIPNKGGFGASDEEGNLEESKEEADNINHLIINKIADNVEASKVPKIPRAESETTVTTAEVASTVISTEVPTTSTESITTETPTAAFAEAEKSLKAHSLNLTHHLNTTNLESFLNTANISSNEAQVFIKLVEKVLEEEVAKRLEKHEKHKYEKESSSTSSSSIGDESASPKQAGIKLQPTDVQTSLDIPDDTKSINDEYIENVADSQKDRHEVKTVDTRLVYQSKAIDDASYDEEEGSSSTVTTPTTPKVFVSKNTPTLSIRTGNVIKLPRRIHSTTSLSLEQARLASSGLKKSQQLHYTDDYRAREQAEFDKIIKESQLSSFNNLHTTVAPITRRQEIAKTEGENYTPMPMTRISSHQTQFERLAKDYQYRLTGTNGLNDLIKALQNAKIGFYERPTYRRYHEQSSN